MEMYDTEGQYSESLRRQQEQAVHAWMRAAAFAAGTEPEDELFALRKRARVESDDSVGSLMAALAAQAVRKAA